MLNPKQLNNCFSFQWNQDCIASLLRLIYQFGIEGNEDDHSTGDGEAPRKRAKRIRKGSNDKLLIPKLNKVSFICHFVCLICILYVQIII